MSETDHRPAEDETVSPEEKLLKVIQRGKKPVASDALSRGGTRPPPPPRHSAEFSAKPIPAAAVQPPAPSAAAPAKPIAAKAVKPIPAAPQKQPSAISIPAPQAGKPAGVDAKAPAAKPAAPKQLGGGGSPPRQLGQTPPVGPAKNTKTNPMGVVATINRVIMAASAVIFIGVVWEIMAARPPMPVEPGEMIAVKPNIATNAPPSFQEVARIVDDRNIWQFKFVSPVSNTNGISPLLKDLVKEKIKIEGISFIRDMPDDSFVVLTVAGKNGKTDAFKKNAMVGVDLPLGDNGSEKACQLIVDTVKEDAVILSYEGTTVQLGGRR